VHVCRREGYISSMIAVLEHLLKRREEVCKEGSVAFSILVDNLMHRGFLRWIRDSVKLTVLDTAPSLAGGVIWWYSRRVEAPVRLHHREVEVVEALAAFWKAGRAHREVDVQPHVRVEHDLVDADDKRPPLAARVAAAESVGGVAAAIGWRGPRGLDLVEARTHPLVLKPLHRPTSRKVTKGMRHPLGDGSLAGRVAKPDASI